MSAREERLKLLDHLADRAERLEGYTAISVARTLRDIVGLGLGVDDSVLRRALQEFEKRAGYHALARDLAALERYGVFFGRVTKEMINAYFDGAPTPAVAS